MNIVPMKVTLIDSMGTDLSICNAARVSFHKESDWHYPDLDELRNEKGDFIYVGKSLAEKDQKLISYLAKHSHWTPFAHAFLSFRIKAPIFVARQLVKHQVGLVWNEVSRRYVDDEPEFWFPEVWRGKPVNAKQGSDGVIEDQEGWNRDFKNQTAHALGLYQAAIEYGMAPEQARMVLPQNTMTEWIWSGSLMAFARVVKLRTDPHAQLETQEIAKQIDTLVPIEFQHSWKALNGCT
jgi:thymidylate synthase (FAD)